MAKEKLELFEDAEMNSALEAKAVYTYCREELQKNSGAIRTCFITYAILIVEYIIQAIDPNIVKGFGDYIWMTWIIGGIIAYAKGGGILMALGVVWRITVFTWRVTPVWIMDMGVALIAFVISGIGALMCPIIFILIRRHQLNRDYKMASRILKAYIAQRQKEIAQQNKRAQMQKARRMAARATV